MPTPTTVFLTLDACRTVLGPQLVERILSCISKLQTSDAASSSSGGKPGSTALKDYMQALSCTKKPIVAPESVFDADSARAAVQSLLQSCVDASAARAVNVLPQIDAASALAGSDQAAGLDADAVAPPAQHKETVAYDQVRHQLQFLPLGSKDVSPSQQTPETIIRMLCMCQVSVEVHAIGARDLRL